MAESFLLDIAESVLRHIASLALAEFSLAWGVKDDLRKLHNTLSNIKAVLMDAEEKQLTSHEIATWLGQLKNVLFDAEDVFDEFAYEALRKKVANTSGGVSTKVRRFFSSSNPITFRLEMGRKVKEIREAFDEVAANKAKFHLNTHLVPRPLVFIEREMTHSFVHTSDIIGRDRERDTIVESLMNPSHGSDENLSVVSVVGFGGLGKTALAKMVFNDTRVVQHFEKRVWVCVGDLNEFNINQVMVKIVTSITGDKSVDSNPEQLQQCLRENLQGKRFLLVLDDVWVVNRAKWLEFKRLLIGGSEGGRVVVTTRSSLVVTSMDSILIHKLEGLNHDECVTLFKKFAFKEGEDDQNLVQIGDVIVRKCKGVPLAVKTLGCLLFSKRDISDWTFVRDNEIWKLEQNIDDILPSLKLSYNQLPFVLKQCFVSCAIFPKDHIFFNIDLIQHWLAYGLLQPSMKYKNIEDVGQRYINELGVRGFFQDFEDFVTMSNFKMHDLIHDLALSMAQDEFKNINFGRQDHYIYKSIKDVSFSRMKGVVGEEVPKSFLKNNSSISGVMPAIWCICFDAKGEEATIGELVKTCITKLKHMRVLDLSDTNLEHLPDSIGSLKHLRYLELQDCRRLKRLPDSITKLYNLQYLSFAGCEELEELPKNIGDLINLRQLLITTKHKRLSAATENGIKSLRSLQFLSFRNCTNLEYLFDDNGDLEQLTSLRTLNIERCESLTSLFRPSASNSIKRSYIFAVETLWIQKCPNLDLASTYSDQIRFSSLRSLIIFHLPQMEALPQWMCPSTLESLAISGCRNLASLPEWLQNLTSLRKLGISGCRKLLCLPTGMQGLTALRDIVIKNCPHLIQRCKAGTGEDWHKIAHIPNLRLQGK